MSLSSWNYGTFSSLNPYHIRINSGNENKRKNNAFSEKKDKIVKQEFFENKQYETYINRDIELKNKFRLEQEQKRFKDLKQLKKFGKTFQVWENLKNKNIRLEKKEKEKKEEEKKGKKEEEGNIVKKNITFNQWKRKLIKKIKKEEEKRLKSEETKKILSERRNKIRRENMKIWKIKKRESIKKEKEDELKKKKDKQLEEEKNNIERKEKNKIEYIKWLNGKIKEGRNRRNSKNNANIINNRRSYKNVKMNEIIGPFFFAKNLREVQKSYYE